MKVPSFVCDDCGADAFNEYYMVHDHLWPWPGTEPGAHNGPGMLCIGCLEVRIGRKLTADDFTDASINKPFPWLSQRLRTRLTS